MAMSKDILGPELANLVLSPKATPDMQAQIIQQWTDIADVIIKHIQTKAVVTVSVSTTGTAAAQTGTGTGTVK